MCTRQAHKQQFLDCSSTSTEHPAETKYSGGRLVTIHSRQMMSFHEIVIIILKSDVRVRGIWRLNYLLFIVPDQFTLAIILSLS